MTFTDVPGPAHEHDCTDGCVYLGSIAAIPGLTGDEVKVMDLYVHRPDADGPGTLIHRTGPDGDYGSMPVDVHRRRTAENTGGDPAAVQASLRLYAEIYRRAVERSVL